MASNYDLAYNLIIDLKNKLNEETILEKKLCISFIDELLDILEIFEYENNEEEIKAILYCLKKSKKDIDKIDVEILKLLSKYNDYYIELLKEKLNNIASELEVEVISLNYNVDSRREFMKVLNEAYQSKFLCSKEIKNRIISIFLTLGIYGSIWLGIGSYSKKICTNDFYNGKITIYSSLDNSTKEKITSFDLNDKNSTYINTYSEVYKTGLFDLKKSRILSSYDVSDYYYGDIEDYLGIDLSSFTYSIKKVDYISKTPYQQYSDVVKIEIDKSTIIPKLNNFLYYLIQLGCMLILELFLIMISSHVIKEKQNDYKKLCLGISLNLISLFKKRNFFEEKEKMKENILNLIDDISNLDVEKNKLILDFEKNLLEFYQLYQKYGKVIDGSQDLLNRVESIKSNSIIRKYIFK